MKALSAFFFFLILEAQASLLGKDFACTDSSQRVYTITDITFVPEMTVKDGPIFCSYKLVKGHFNKRGPQPLTAHLINKDCPSSKKRPFLDKAVMKIEVANKRAFIHIFQGKQPVQCKVKKIKTEKLINNIEKL